jgi:hypothetical protein
MSYRTFESYLAGGGFTMRTTADEFAIQKSEVGLKAVVSFACKNNHVTSLTVSSLKNKKHKFKDSYEGFCSKCVRGFVQTHVNIPVAENIPTSSVEAENIPTSSVEAENIPTSSVEAENIPTSSVEAENIPTSSVEAENMPTSSVEAENMPTSSVEAENMPTVLPEYRMCKYADAEPEFTACYIERRTALFSAHTNINGLVFDCEPYIDLVQKWFKECTNMFTRTRLRNADVFMEGGKILVTPIPGVCVFVQTVTSYNADPPRIFDMYRRRSAGTPYMIFMFDGGEIIDVWYFIPGKKGYSVTHKHACDFRAKVSGYSSHDEPDYYYFERTMFELELSDLK